MIGTRAAQSPQHPVSPSKSATRARTPLIYAGVLALFSVAILAASLSGTPRFTPGKSEPEPLPPPDPVATFSGAPFPPQQPSDNPPSLLIVLAVIVALIVVAALVAGAVWLVRVLVRAWRERRLQRRPGISTDAAISSELIVENTVDEPTIRRGIAAARATIITHAEAGDAIVAAWVGLEETAADSGVGRGKSETPAEFTLRILLRRPGIEQAARDLLALYEGVRFGGHAADEQMRAAAVHALDVIEEGWR